MLKSAGIDPDVYTGFAFGVGMERTLLLRSDINDAMLNVADGDTDIYDYVDVRERVGFIDSVMRSMPDKRREIFAMRYDRNMTNAEIARALNLSIRTVEKHVDLAIKQIRKTISVVTLFFVLFF